MADAVREARRRARRERIKARGHDKVISDGQAWSPAEIAARCPGCAGEKRRVVQGKGWVVCDVCGGSGQKGGPDVIDRALDQARALAAERNGTAAS